jgi:hypothetical protein
MGWRVVPHQAVTLCDLRRSDDDALARFPPTHAGLEQCVKEPSDKGLAGQEQSLAMSRRRASELLWVQLLRSPARSPSPHKKSRGMKGLRHIRQISGCCARTSGCNAVLHRQACSSYMRSGQFLYGNFMRKASAPSRIPMCSSATIARALGLKVSANAADQLQLGTSLKWSDHVGLHPAGRGTRLLRPIDCLRIRLRSPLRRVPCSSNTFWEAS